MFLRCRSFLQSCSLNACSSEGVECTPDLSGCVVIDNRSKLKLGTLVEIHQFTEIRKFK